jgi:hypothetical protein
MNHSASPVSNFHRPNRSRPNLVAGFTPIPHRHRRRSCPQCRNFTASIRGYAPLTASDSAPLQIERAAGAETMTFDELVRSAAWDDVERELRLLDDSERQIAGYRSVFDYLQTLVARPTPMRIVLTREPRNPEDGPMIEVIGRNGRKNRESRDFEYLRGRVDDEWPEAEIDWALSLESWESWLGMQIDPLTLHDFEPPVIVAQCLVDMTFHGFTQEEVRSFADRLASEVGAIDAMTDEEREQYLIPADEVFARLRDQSRN